MEKPQNPQLQAGERYYNSLKIFIFMICWFEFVKACKNEEPLPRKRVA